MFAKLVNFSLSMTVLLFCLSAQPVYADNKVDIVVKSLNQLLKQDSQRRAVSVKRQLGVIGDSAQAKVTAPTPFIIGGITVPRSRYPEFALVLEVNSVGDIVGLCGGTMIDRNKVLTAGHCSQAPAADMFVVPGFYSFNDQLVASNLFSVSLVSVHPEYNDETLSNDVAILTTARNYSGLTAAVLSGTNKLVNFDSTVVGVGLVSTLPETLATTLQEVTTPISSNGRCNQAWFSAAGIRPIQSNMLCAGFPNDGRGSCSGDSGGPLFITVETQRVVAGTVSFGLPRCEDNGGTSAYARVSSMTDFISEKAPGATFVTLNQPFASSAIFNLLFDTDSPPPLEAP